jgi:glycosyltransferase involved in cell wall biosynthesis
VQGVPVLILSRSGSIDGSQRQLLYLVQKLDQQRWPVTVALDGAGEFKDALCALDIEALVCRMSPWRLLTSCPARYRDAYRLLTLARARNIRLVHANDVWRAEYAGFIARRLGIPFIVHVRGPLAPRDIRKHRLHRADAIIAIAKRYAADLAAAGIDSRRVAVIDDAVDCGRFFPLQADCGNIRRDLVGEGSLLVGLVGRVSKFKRVLEFLEMVARLPPEAAASARFVVIGDWSEQDYERRIRNALLRLDLATKVRFLGRRPGEDMPSLLSSLDVLVTLSGGSVMFEAMACGTPVLSIRADGRHSEHTRHDETAWCVSSDDPSVAARALAHLLHDEALRRRLGAAGRRWAKQYLSVEIMAENTQALYERLTVTASPAVAAPARDG